MMSVADQRLPIDPVQLRADFPILAKVLHGDKPLVYLDNAATTQKPESVIEAIAGRKVHSPGIVPGGIAEPMTEETREQISAGLAEARAELRTAPLDQVAELAEKLLAGFVGVPSLLERADVGPIAPTTSYRPRRPSMWGSSDGTNRSRTRLRPS